MFLNSVFECRRKTGARGGSHIDKVYGYVPAFSGGFSQIWYIDRVVFVTDESAQFCKIGCILENFGKKAPNFSQIGCFSIKIGILMGGFLSQK